MPAEDRHIYGEVENKSDIDKVFRDIRKDVATVRSRPGLTELYKRAGYLVTLTHAPSWEKKFGDGMKKIRDEAIKEFAATAHKINARARVIGTADDYDERWGRN